MKLCELPKKLKVTVTAADIRNGKKNSTCDCPIALAIRRQLKVERGEIEVSSSISLKPRKMPWWGAYDFISYDLSLRADRFIRAFDEGEKVKPFSFTAEGG